MKTFVIFPVIFFFLHTSPALQVSDKNGDNMLQSVYLIKQHWHTALVFTIDQMDTLLIPEARYFKNYQLIDFGWGDEEFYQYPGFDSGLAFGALFYATPSTIRVEGLSYSKEDLFKYSEIVVKLLIDENQLLKINKFISSTFYRDEMQNSTLISSHAGGKIKFFKSPYKYHLFNTCNTWIAEALVYAGFKLEKNILLAEQLFNEAAKIGVVIKAPKD